MFSVIVACDSQFGIGNEKNEIPWKSKKDMKFFRDMTKDSVVIMGGNTFRSLKKPLKGRDMLIISHTLMEPKECTTNNIIKVFRDPMTCVRFCMKKYKNIKIFICGGKTIYDWFHANRLINCVYLTSVYGDFGCSVFYDYYKFKLDNDYKKELIIKYDAFNEEPRLEIYKYQFINKEELNMLDLMHDVINNGNKRMDRTSIGTLSLFGKQFRFDLTNNTFPLMTTRPVFLRGVFEELMLFIRGQTDTTILESKNINIWKGNTSREFLDKQGLHHLSIGDMGHSYGFSFRHFGANYINSQTDYKNKGYDQLKNVIDEIKNNPTGRRHIISLWEPNNLHKTPLPPCLFLYQFYIADDNLSCMMTQRSSDFGVAGGWNVATGALLTILIANICKLKPYELIWNIGDVHIYNNILSNTLEQLKRQPNIYPKLFINNKPIDIELFEFENLELINYKPLDKIDFVMNI